MKLFVGNLPFNAKSEELKELFETIGQVESADVIVDKFTNRSRGFGFVTMPNDEEAEMAIQKLNNATLGNRNIKVSEAKPLRRRDE